MFKIHSPLLLNNGNLFSDFFWETKLMEIPDLIFWKAFSLGTVSICFFSASFSVITPVPVAAAVFSDFFGLTVRR